MKKTVKVDVLQIDLAPTRYIVRQLEDAGVATVFNTLLTQVNPLKQVLCIYPQGLEKAPTSWDEIKSGRFWVINGQHSVKAAQRILEEKDLPPDRKSMFRTWEAEVVWSEEPWRIQSISEYYNQSNRILPFKPTWASNLIHCRRIWEEMGQPTKLRANARGKVGADDWTVRAAATPRTIVDHFTFGAYHEVLSEGPVERIHRWSPQCRVSLMNPKSHPLQEITRIRNAFTEPSFSAALKGGGV